jgi:hypothetical protein
VQAVGVRGNGNVKFRFMTSKDKVNRELAGAGARLTSSSAPGPQIFGHIHLFLRLRVAPAGVVLG